ncbi:zinc finger protein [Macleaya cordata]|uniref:Zinc finger protein n=1 Tax=Macleaya cordata TaxID=56857 RepID=A0A200PLX5_MACCD|nr:zinc finger protein [Macleaya cordata]
MKPRFCELCTEEATLYCESDSSFLCWNCDSKVHGANFLVARHIRRTICSKCKGFDRNCMSGFELRPFRPICLSCSSDSDKEDVDSLTSASFSSSDCFSTAESVTVSAPKTIKISFDRKKLTKNTCSSSVTDTSGETTNFPVNFTGEESSKMKTDRTRRFRDLTDVDMKVDGVLVDSCKKLGKVSPRMIKSDGKKRFKPLTNVDSKVESILVNWCNKLGLPNSCSVLPLASHAFRVCNLQKLTFLPFRVALASSFWFSLKFLGGISASTCQNLKRLEEISGVPVKLIILAESKISRVLNLNRRSKLDLEEGWAEC